MSVQPLNHQPDVAHSLRSRLTPAIRELAAGPWSAQLVGDELAHLSYAGRPVLRAVKAVVRDQDWRTLQPFVDNVDVTEGDGGLHVCWSVKYAGYGVKYDALLAATFTPAAVEIAFEGTATHAFRSNRIGLVVLHPPSDAGREVTVEHPDRSITASQFPRDISPQQPFMDIAALEWADAGTAFRLEVTGDVFETEDQRNWTDASFKTYSTPLALPFPVHVSAGDVVRQSVLLEAAMFEPQEAAEIVAAGTMRRPDVVCRVSAILGAAEGRVPALAVGAGQQLELVPRIPGLDALVVELVERAGDNHRASWSAGLEAATAAAGHWAGLDIRIVAADPVGAVADVAPYLAAAKRLAVFDPGSHLTEPDTWQQVKSAARTAGFTGELLAGVRSHFTELNRSSGRMPQDSDALTFSITAQMHSTEIAHIIDSVPMQRLVARNALRLDGGKPLHVGPVTLLPRFNAVATSGVAAELETDELQGHPFTAAWTLASIAALTMEGIASISYFEATGPRGICDDAGRLNPAGELLKELAALRGNLVVAADMKSGPTGIDRAVTLYPVQSPAGLMVFAGNLSAQAVEVDLQLPTDFHSSVGESRAFGAGDGSVVTFDPKRYGGPTQGRLTLGPWSSGVVRFPLPG